MDKKTLCDEFGNIETDLTSIIKRLSDMQQAVNTLAEQNVNLEIENRHLRERLMELEAATVEQDEEKQGLSKSRLNLEKIYEEGFHVCNICYGTRRENDEECAFCLDVIYGERR